MSGSAQAANLTGMLSQLANSVGEMGQAHDYLAQNIRDYAAPKLDQNDPQSMMAYAKWAQNNGQQELAIKMQGAAAQKQLQAKQAKGMAAMEGLRAQLEANRSTMSPEEIAAVETKIMEVGVASGMTPTQLAQVGTRRDQRQDKGNEVRQQDKVIGINEIKVLHSMGAEDRKIALAELSEANQNRYRMGRLQLSEDELQLSRDQFTEMKSQFVQNFDLKSQIAEDNYNLSSWDMRLREEMQGKQMEVMDVNMLSTELRDDIARDLANNTISDSSLARIINLNTEERNQGLYNIQMEMAPVRIKMLAADLDLTKAQTDMLLARTDELIKGAPDRLAVGAAAARSAETAADLAFMQAGFYKDTLDNRRRLSDLAVDLAETNIDVLEFDMDNKQDLFDLKEAWTNEQISASQLRTLYLGNADARAENREPEARRLIRAQVANMAARTDMTIAQTDSIFEALGFSESTRELQKNRMKLDNKLLGIQIEGAEIGNEVNERRLETMDLTDEQIEANIDAIYAGIELGSDRLKEQQRVNRFSEGITLQTLEQSNIRLGMEGARLQAHLRMQGELMLDKRLQRRTIASNIMAQEGILRLSNIVYNSGLDVSDKTRVSNARKIFVAENGGSSGRIFDEAVNVMRATARVDLELEKAKWNAEDAKPIEAQDLLTMGMGEKQVGEIMALSGNSAKNAEISKWITRNNTKDNIRPPTPALLEVYEPLAKDIVRATFAGVFGYFDKQWDSEVIGAASIAMARAAASGATDAEVMLAGHAALEPFAYRTDFEAKGKNIVELRQALED